MSMENLIDYVIYALMGYEVKVKPYVSEVSNRRQWLLSFGFHQDISLILDDADLATIKYVAENRELDDDERERYEKLFELCQ